MPMYDVAVQVIFNKPPPLSKSGCLPYFIIAVCTRVFSLCLVVSEKIGRVKSLGKVCHQKIFKCQKYLVPKKYR